MPFPPFFSYGIKLRLRMLWLFTIAIFGVHGHGLVYNHQVYQGFRVAIPVIVGANEELALEKPRELLAQAVRGSPACPAWIADTSSLFIAIAVSFIAVDNMVINVDASVGNFFFAAFTTLNASTSVRSMT